MRRGAAMLAPLLATPLLATGFLVAGCGGNEDDGPRSEPSASSSSTSSSPAGTPAATLRYVALGDSYTAAPGIAVTSTDGCQRSDHDYPHLLAAQRPDVELVDVSCSGATSDDVLHGQLDAVTAGTGLVTVGVGGNDDGFSAQLIGGCLSAATRTGQAICADLYGPGLAGQLDGIRDGVAEVLAAVGERAPRARVLVVGYPEVVPADDSCAGRLPIGAADLRFLAGALVGLNRALSQAARTTGAEFVDLARATAGHGLCSEDPWINGASAPPGEGAPLHPRPEEQTAAGDAVSEVLSR